MLHPTPTVRLALIGNPNTGKTTLFNACTGMRQRSANYPGVTVEIHSGRLQKGPQSRHIELLDLPGSYTLSARSADEAFVLEAMLSIRPELRLDGVICVVDASNLARNLFLVSQVLDLHIPTVVALTMVDVAKCSGAAVNASALSRELGVPVIEVNPRTGLGLDQLATAMLELPTQSTDSHAAPAPPLQLGLQAQRLASMFVQFEGRPAMQRAAAVHSILNPDTAMERLLLDGLDESVRTAVVLSRSCLTDADLSISSMEAAYRYAWIDRIVARVLARTPKQRKSRSEAVDRLLTHPILGLIPLTVLMAVCFQAVFSWSAPFMDVIDGSIAGLGNFLGRFLPQGALRSLAVDGAVAGVGAVLVFLPQIIVLFFFIAVIEDCGYLARAVVLLDRWMERIGLSGRAFLPLLSSFACAVPGILSTRVMETRRDRLVTMLIAPLMSCSARLPVYVLFISAFVPDRRILGGLFSLQGATLWAMYSIGAVVAIPVAWLLKRTMLRGESPSLLLELPTYKWPSLRTILVRVYLQGREFITSAGTVIFAVTVLIWALGYYPRPASVGVEFDRQRSALPALSHASTPVEIQLRDAQIAAISAHESGAYLRQSFLGRFGGWVEPLVKPLGWDWRIGTAVIASFPAREVVIATMGTIYNLGAETDATSDSLRSALQAASWPDGKKIFTLPVALSVMVFFALCCQCGATLAAIYRESGSWIWPALTFTYMTTLAYVAAWATYETGLWLLGGA